ncbi:MAG TPA: sigma-54 dependent transcriptional regulator [Pyrinomonadaceae bacterium]|nr:sigma-54 dependent transcriptional regulator [Pyrinomonadaceae bacterium]
MAELLIADDEKGYREVLRAIFADQGHTVHTANDGRAALAHLKEQPCDVVISDVRMPDMDGIAFLQAARAFYPEIGIVLMTAFGTIDTAREAFKLGADDFIQKPFNNDELRLIVERALERRAMLHENRALRTAQRRVGSTANIVGSSEAIRRLHEQIGAVAREEATILITGESGSGKELVARAIHDLSDRAEKPFIPINCGALTETLLEAELFGFIKGSFTGAAQSRAGMFESAEKGSIFLDEIGDMSPAMQVKVLRVLQERKVRRIGAGAETCVDTRVLAATNRDLGPLVDEGKFRRDLFYRVSVIPIRVPSLRERREDIPELALHFVNRFSARSGKQISITDEALSALQNRSWPGNVRELENTIERAVAFTPSGESISLAHCVEQSHGNGHQPAHLPIDGLHLPAHLNSLEKSYVEEALSRCSGNQTRAAELLKIPVHSLRHLLDKHELR